MAISPDGRTLAIGGDGFGLWELSTGRQLHILDPFTAKIRCAVFESDG